MLYFAIPLWVVGGSYELFGASEFKKGFNNFIAELMALVTNKYL